MIPRNQIFTLLVVNQSCIEDSEALDGIVCGHKKRDQTHESCDGGKKWAGTLQY